MRLVSSRLTFFYRYIIPAFLICSGITMSVVVGQPFLVLFPVPMLLFNWTLLTLKRVSVDGDTLVISNFRKEIRVPLRDVLEIRQNVWWGAGVIRVMFRSPTAFGTMIRFVPAQAYMHLPFCEHRIVGELRDLARRANVPAQ